MASSQAVRDSYVPYVKSDFCSRSIAMECITALPGQVVFPVVLQPHLPLPVRQIESRYQASVPIADLHLRPEGGEVRGLHDQPELGLLWPFGPRIYERQ